MGVVIIIAMVAVLLPVCMAVSCGMSPMSMMGTSMLGFSSDCGSTMTSAVQAAIAPGSPQSLILMLVAAFGVASVLASPRLSTRLVRAVAEDPHAPPDDPRGVRLII
jgi:hypothetical protein